MKVLITWHSAVEGSYRKFFEELSRSGADVTAVVPSRWTEGGRTLTLEGPAPGNNIRVFKPVFADHIRAFFYPDITGLAALLKGLKPEIIHIMEEPYSLAAFEFIALKKMLGLRSRMILFSFENMDIPQRPPYSFFQRFNLRNTDALVCVPREGVELWRKRGFAGEIYNLPIGIDTDLFSPVKDLRQATSTGRDRAFHIGYTGRVVREKGLDTLIEALSILKGWGVRAGLSIVGNGVYLDTLKGSVRRKGLEGDVVFESAVPQEDLPALYTRFDLLVLPSITTDSWKEQFGRVLVEAMACGVPVVGSSSGEIPAVLGDAGVLFREGDPVELALSIKKVMDDTGLRRELVRRGIERVRKKFTWEAVSAGYMKIYESLAEDGRKISPSVK